MRCVVALVLGIVLVLGQPARADTESPGAEAGFALAAAMANAVYLPAKLVFAGVGLVAGAVTGFVSGGDTRAAYALWVPTATGTFLLTPAHASGERPIEFVGSDYPDRRSGVVAREGAVAYDALYVK